MPDLNGTLSSLINIKSKGWIRVHLFQWPTFPQWAGISALRQLQILVYLIDQYQLSIEIKNQ